MKKLILISLVIFFVICSRSWADTSLFHNHLGNFTYNLFWGLVLGTPLLIVILIGNKTTTIQYMFYGLISLFLSFISLFIISFLYGASYLIGIIAYCIFNFTIYKFAISKYKKKIKLKEEEHKITHESLHKVNDGGYVYIMTCNKWNEDGLVKIGKSNNIERRLNDAQKEVQGTYSPYPPKIDLYHYQFSRYYNELEKHIHMKLENRKFRSDASTATEFFRLTPEEAKAELDIAIREIEEKMAS